VNLSDKFLAVTACSQGWNQSSVNPVELPEKMVASLYFRNHSDTFYCRTSLF